jgi:hypothetical protein
MAQLLGDLLIATLIAAGVLWFGSNLTFKKNPKSKRK